MPAPRPHDAEEHPWCACCTAQLSDEDSHSPGLSDSAHPHICYRLRRDEDLPLTHSNLHNDLICIHRTNADYHRSQRDIEEAQQTITGTLPNDRPTTSYTNTPAATNIQRTIHHFQFERYQRRGGRLPQGEHSLDYTFNSPNITNMQPGSPYRQWLHGTISRTHYSLGEATDHYNQWLNDPDYGPNPHPHNRTHDSLPYLPHSRCSPSPPDSPDYAPKSPPVSKPPTPYPSSDDSQDNDYTHKEARTQTFVQDIHTSLDDSNAVLDSGVMMTTAPRCLLIMTSSEWESNIHPAPPGTAIRYGNNMETEPVEEVFHIGSYPLSIVLNRYRTALVCVHDIVAAGHVVTFTHDKTCRQRLHPPNTIPENGEYPFTSWNDSPIDLRAAHPLHHGQVYTNDPSIN